MSRVSIVIANLPRATPRGSYTVKVMVGSECIGQVAMFGTMEHTACRAVTKRPTMALTCLVYDIDATCAVLDVPPHESVAARLAALKTALEGPRVTYRVHYGSAGDVSEPLDALPCRQGMRPKTSVHVHDRESAMPHRLVTGIYHVTAGAAEDGMAESGMYHAAAGAGEDAMAALRSTVRLMTRSRGHAYSATGFVVQLPSSALRLRAGEAVSAVLFNRDLFVNDESFRSVEVTACGGSVEILRPTVGERAHRGVRLA